MRLQGGDSDPLLGHQQQREGAGHPQQQGVRAGHPPGDLLVSYFLLYNGIRSYARKIFPLYTYI